MAAQSFTASRGASFMKISDFTTGTNAPSANDFELRWNTTDTNSHNITREDIIIFLMGAVRMLQQGGATVDLLTLAGTGTATPPPV